MTFRRESAKPHQELSAEPGSYSPKYQYIKPSICSPSFGPRKSVQQLEKDDIQHKLLMESKKQGTDQLYTLPSPFERKYSRGASFAGRRKEIVDMDIPGPGQYDTVEAFQRQKDKVHATMGARTLRPGVVEFDMKHRCNGTSPNTYQDNGKYKTDAKNIKISPYRYKAYKDDIPGPGAYNDENSTRYGKMKGPQITIGNKFSQN